MAEIKLPVTLLGDIVLRREAGRLIDAAGTDIGLGWGPENAHALKDALNEHAALRAQVARVRALAEEWGAPLQADMGMDKVLWLVRRRPSARELLAAIDGEGGATQPPADGEIWQAFVEVLDALKDAGGSDNPCYERWAHLEPEAIRRMSSGRRRP